jgi:hypothetical protein
MSIACLIACKKDSSVTNVAASKEIKLENVKFASTSPKKGDDLSTMKLSTYDEQACTTKVDSSYQAGTKCFSSVGNTCSTLHNCTPLSNLASSGKFTKAEIDNKIQIIEKAYNIKYTY